MVAECEHIGLAPMSKEDFVKEDGRLYADLARRRAGIYR